MERDGVAQHPCVGPDTCPFAMGDCKAYARLNVLIGDGEEDALGSFVLRTTSFNTIRTLAARLQYFSAVSGGRPACMPLELKLRGKSTVMSHRSAIYYVDLVVRAGLSLEQAVVEAIQKDLAHRTIGLDQAALDEAARQGFANGAFEDSPDDAPAIVEEFYPSEIGVEAVGVPLKGPVNDPCSKLERKTTQVGGA
jgi:hypothetical protein